MANTPHDPYLSMTIEIIGVERTIIALQQTGAREFRNYCKFRDYHMSTFHGFAIATQENASWYYRQARILMGIE